MIPTARPGVVRPGDRVLANGDEHTVVGLHGTSVRLQAASGIESVVLLAWLLSAPDFELLDGDTPGQSVGPIGLLDTVPPEIARAAREWERHIIEVETGLPPGTPTDAVPPLDCDPARLTLAQREAAKAEELTKAGKPTTARRVRRMRERYRAGGLWGLVDHRSTPPAKSQRRVDSRVVEATQKAIEELT